MTLGRLTYEQMYFYIKHNKGKSHKVLNKELKIPRGYIEEIKVHIGMRILENMPPAKPKPNNTYILKESELLYVVPTFDEIKQEYKELEL
jgi:hypothetical protein